VWSDSFSQLKSFQQKERGNMADNSKTCDFVSGDAAPSEQDRRQALTRLAAQYLRDLPHQLDRIRSTLDMKDYDEIKKQAHRIKGTSGTYQFDLIAQSAAQLELLAESRDSQAIAATINELMRLVDLETKKLNAQQLSSPTNAERDANA
jgi:HPt (histidine-containing phosphotransfer) domain-containing protein